MYKSGIDSGALTPDEHKRTEPVTSGEAKKLDDRDGPNMRRSVL
jgi:hypothetical protein